MHHRLDNLPVNLKHREHLSHPLTPRPLPFYLSRALVRLYVHIVMMDETSRHRDLKVVGLQADGTPLAAQVGATRALEDGRLGRGADGRQGRAGGARQRDGGARRTHGSARRARWIQK